LSVAPSPSPAAGGKPDIRKYAFDLVFDAAGHTTLREDRHARRFSEEELEMARAEGERAGRAEAQAAAETALAAQLEAAARAAQRLEAALLAETALLRQEAARLAFAMAAKVSGRALEAFGSERVIEAFDQALETLGDETRIVVRIRPDAVDRLRPRLQETAKAHGFAGTLVVRAADAAGAGDVTIEWADGAMSLHTEALLARLEDALAQDEWGLAASGTQEP
jgi:flagellar assembly protein FliH